MPGHAVRIISSPRVFALVKSDSSLPAAAELSRRDFVRHGTALAAAPTAGADREVALLSEIIVTAQKREQTLQDVPISITVSGTSGISFCAKSGTTGCV